MLFKEDTVARAQHQSVRENVGWFQWTHDLVEIKGADAGRFLDYLFVNSINKSAVGRTKSGPTMHPASTDTPTAKARVRTARAAAPGTAPPPRGTEPVTTKPPVTTQQRARTSAPPSEAPG